MHRARFVSSVLLVAILVAACSSDGGTGSVRSNEQAARSGETQAKREHPYTPTQGRERLAALTRSASKGVNVSRQSPGSLSFQPCKDPWVTDAILEVTGSGSPPTGKVCDPYLYGNANWNSYPELVQFVRDRFAMYCGDLWVTQAVMEVFDRVPQNSIDCDYSQYAGGQWNSYQELKDGMWRFRFTDPPAPTSRWRMLVLIFQRTALPDLGIAGTPLTTQMDQGDVDHIKSISRRPLKEAVSTLSKGAVSLSVDFVSDAGTITSLSRDGNSWWVGPRDVRDSLDRYAPEGTYDSVVVYWRNDDGATRLGPNLGGIAKGQEIGLAIGRHVGTADQGYRDGTNGAGFASITLPTAHADFGNGGQEPSHHLIMHEWLHQAEGTYRDYEPLVWGEDALPNCETDRDKASPGLETDVFLHCAEFYGFSSKPGIGWGEWYLPVMQGTVNGSLGFWASIWRAGPPRFLR